MMNKNIVLKLTLACYAAGFVSSPMVVAEEASAIDSGVMSRLTIVSQTQAMAGAFSRDEPSQNANPTAVAKAIGAALQSTAARLGSTGHNATPARPAAANTKRVAALGSSTNAMSADYRNARSKKSRLRFNGAGAPSAAQHQALQSLSASVQGNIRANLSASGTPREIRVKRFKNNKSRSLRANTVMQASVGSPRATARAFLVKNAGLLRLDDPVAELLLESNSVDDLGRRQLRFSQHFNNVPVWAAELTVHMNESGGVDLLNGSFVPTPKKLDTVARIDGAAAARLALGQFLEYPGAVVNGPARAVIYPRESGARLAWEVTVVTAIDQHWQIMIDAVNGVELNRYNAVMTIAGNGSGADLFGITRNFGVWQQGNNFHLVDTSKQMFDPSSTPPSASTTRGGIVILDAGNQPGDPNRDQIPQSQVTSTTPTAGWIPDAVSAAYGFSETYDYFLERHNRNSLDNRGGSILATVRVGQNFFNAFFVSGQQAMFFGDAEIFAGALDVVAHELSHGVISNTSNLVYQNQSGALNESFSDIFGTLVQARTNGQVEWVVGDQFTDRSLLRDMKDPSSLTSPLGVPYPMRMSQFVQTTQDNGGVHINSSIPNHAFYLYAEGLSGAVGLEDAANVFYRAFTVHLTQRSQFIDARLAVIRSAEELFGAGSNQAVKAAEAFDAVEVFAAPSTPAPAPFPEVDGPESTLAVAFDNSTFETVLIRREQAAGDLLQGNRLSVFGIAEGKRPAVSGDGSFVAFVNAFNDLCLIPTDGSSVEQCLGFAGTIHSVAMTPDARLLSFIVLDQIGNPSNLINVTEIETGFTFSFELVSPALDGVSTNSVANADAMDFTSDGRLLIYDGLNLISLDDGSQIGLWSIFAIDLISGRTLTLVPPQPGIDISFPTVSQASDRYFTFDAFDQQTGQSTVVAVDLETGQGSAIANIASGFGVPGYSGDDSAIIYSQFDPSVATQFSLLRQPLAADRLTPQGAPELWLPDADFGVIYRRGTFVGAPNVNLVVNIATDAQSVAVGQTFNYRVTVQNLGSDPSTQVVLTDTIPGDVTLGNITSSQGSCLVGGAQVSCDLGVIAGGGAVNLVVPVSATAVGMLTIASNVVSAENDRDVDNNAAVANVLVTNSAPPASRPASAVLPGSRSVQLGSVASAFATLINTDSVDLEGCTLTPLTSLPARFFFQTSDPATNSVTGAPNEPASLTAGAAQSFVFGFTPTAAFAPTEVELSFDCGNSEAAGIVAGVNTLLLSASNEPVADIVALGATATGDGILDITGINGAAAFAVATVNVGTATTISVNAEATDVELPLDLSVCETNPTTGQCLAAPAASVSTVIGSGGTPTFSVFAQGNGNVDFDPANNRLRVVFREGGVIRGTTSVAVRTR